MSKLASDLLVAYEKRLSGDGKDNLAARLAAMSAAVGELGLVSVPGAPARTCKIVTVTIVGGGSGCHGSGGGYGGLFTP